jgi:AraC-like DNA-binding protein
MHNWVAATPTGRVFHSALHTPLGRITWAGRHLDQPQARMRMRYWDTYSAVYVLRGRGRFHDQDGLNLPVRAGDLMLMFPRHGYRYQADPDEPWSEFFIQFRGPLFGLWVKEGLLNPKRPIHHIEPIEHWRARLEAIIRPLDLPEPAQSLRRVTLLQDFLIDAAILPETPATARDERWLAAARAALAKDLDKPPDWDAIATTLGLSYHHFRRRFTQLAGASPARYRAAKAIEHAEDLLHNPLLAPRAIARQCGFYDEFHFAKRFKTLTGLTPAQFRRRLD